MTPNSCLSGKNAKNTDKKYQIEKGSEVTLAVIIYPQLMVHNFVSKFEPFKINNVGVAKNGVSALGAFTRSKNGSDQEKRLKI